jgi:putative membrane protein
VTGLEIAIVALIVFALLVPVAILTVIFLRLRALLSTRDPKRVPLQILQERFARGEIDEAEYRERRRILESDDS